MIWYRCDTCNADATTFPADQEEARRMVAEGMTFHCGDCIRVMLFGAPPVDERDELGEAGA